MAKLKTITSNEIRFEGNNVGQGSFGVCRLGILTRPDVSDQQVVVKKLLLRAGNNEDTIWRVERMMQEVLKLHTVAQESDSFVEVLYLYNENSSAPMFAGYAMPYYRHGNMRASLLQISRIDPGGVPWLTALWMLKIADGFHHLQTRSGGAILHRDLALDNVLITDCLSVKIADFGQCKELGTELSLGSEEFERRRAFERTAPERIDNPSLQPDLYEDRFQYGVCTVEAFSRKSLRLEYQYCRHEYLDRVRDGKQVGEFQHLVDASLVNCGSEQLRQTAMQVVRMTAHQEPQQRATFAEVKDLWELCDRDRMEAERQRVMEALARVKTDAKVAMPEPMSPQPGCLPIVKYDNRPDELISLIQAPTGGGASPPKGDQRFSRNVRLEGISFIEFLVIVWFQNGIDGWWRVGYELQENLCRYVAELKKDLQKLSPEVLKNGKFSKPHV